MSQIYTKKGDTLKGDKIVAEARKISNPVVIVKSGRHKAQRVILKDNALCRIAKKYKFIK
jgi:acyl-CoA synthetase (NDP forming)